MLIGENIRKEKIQRVQMVGDKFHITVIDANGATKVHMADRVINSLGFENQHTLALATRLETELVIGSASFPGSSPSMRIQIEALSRQAEELNSVLREMP